MAGVEEAAALREIKAFVAESDRNRRCVEARPGAIDFLVTRHSSAPPRSESDNKADNLFELDSLRMPAASPAEDALRVLCVLQLFKPSDKSLAEILDRPDAAADFLDALASVLRRPSYRARTYTILLLKSMAAVMPPARLVAVSDGLVREAVCVVPNRVSSKAVRAAMHVLCRLCPWGRNRVKAAEAGAVTTLVELLLDEGGGRVTELAIVAIDRLCLTLGNMDI
ncbi:hypothetical protein U9M48_001394 [Paspalum notatum var. saurae]|uniref:U-box domain-containing protein n=1 Tax=Paspalum notatum var. saurae TaxID=547442 RepID=A0AAQ3PNN1_PASNO